MVISLTFGQCLPSESKPQKAIIADVDGGRPMPISGRTQAALDAAALAVFVYRSQEFVAHA